MSYKSLLTVLTDPEYATGVLEQLAGLGEAFDAHVDALCIGVDRAPQGFYQAAGDMMVLQVAVEQAQEDSKKLEELAEATLGAANVRHSVESSVSAIAMAGDLVAERARFADLVMMPLPYGEGKGEDMQTSVEAALFGGRAPVLILPDGAAPKAKFGTVMVAWDESAEAMTAIRKSMPFLEAADLVRIVTIDPPVHRADRADPGGQLSRMLDRHGVNCQVDVLSKTLPRTSDVLMRHCADTEAELIVMGAYGHSRLREAILGGTTRNMLENAPVPVLMAH
ncbi:MAG: universal stress protein [Paracoccaceae bacterium]